MPRKATSQGQDCSRTPQPAPAHTASARTVAASLGTGDLPPPGRAVTATAAPKSNRQARLPQSADQRINESLIALDEKRGALCRRLADERAIAAVAKDREWLARLVLAFCEERHDGDRWVVGTVKTAMEHIYSQEEIAQRAEVAQRKAQRMADVEAASAQLDKHEKKRTEHEANLTAINDELTKLKTERTKLEAELTTLQDREKLFDLFERMIGKPRNIGAFLTATTAKFSGKDRQAILKEIYKAIDAGRTNTKISGSDRTANLNTMDNTTVAGRVATTKEDNPIHVIIGSPRMGKSRACERLFEMITKNRSTSDGTARGTLLFAIRISFNGRTPLTAAARSPRDAEIEILWRVLHTLCEEFTGTDEPLCKQSAPFVTWGDIREQVQLLVGEAVRIVLIADEFSKLLDQVPVTQKEVFVSMVTSGVYGDWKGSLVVTGFHVNAGTPFASASGRPIYPYFMGAITAATAQSYNYLRAAAKRCCTPQLYHLIRFVPGLLGLAVEMYGKMKDKKPLFDLNAPILTRIRSQESVNSILLPYLRHVVKGDTTEERRGIEACKVMEDLDQAGVLLQYQREATTFGVLNPLYAYEMVAMMLLSTDSSTAADGVDGIAVLCSLWTELRNARDIWLEGDSRKGPLFLSEARAKGAYLELLLLFCLTLRARLTPPQVWTVEAFVTCLAGKPLIGPPKGTKCLPQDTKLTLWIATKSVPLSFPCAVCSQGPQEGEDRVKHEQSLAQIYDLLRDKGIGTFRPTSEFNGGCDVVQLGTMTLPRGTPVESPRFVMMFATKFVSKTQRNVQEVMAAKAAICAIGLMANYRGQFGRAVFAFLTTQKGLTGDAWDGDALRRKRFALRSNLTSRVFNAEVEAVNDELRKRGATELLPDPAIGEYTLDLVLGAMSLVDPGCAFSVHAVQCGNAKDDPSPELDACMLETFTYLLPKFSV